MKNNTPACILISPEKYEEMTEQLENYSLFIEAEKLPIRLQPIE